MPLDPEERRARRRVAFDPILQLSTVEMEEYIVDLREAWDAKDFDKTVEAIHNLHMNIDHVQMSLNAILPIDFLEKLVSDQIAAQTGAPAHAIHEMRTMDGETLVAEIAADMGRHYLETAEEHDAHQAEAEAEDVVRGEGPE